MVNVRHVVQIMGFRLKLNDIDKAQPTSGQPITAYLIFKDKSIPTYCEFHSRDLTWLTCNALWYLISRSILVETKPKEFFKANDIKYKINHFEFFKNKSNLLKELVGDEIYNYLINNVDVTQRY